MPDTQDIVIGRPSHAVAVAVVEDLNLEASNRAFADHWLSLWRGDAPPPRAAFNPAKLKPYLSSLIMFDTVPGKSVRVRLAGTLYRQILGTELTGKDWIAAAPESHRALRLQLFSAIALGAIGMCHRRVAMTVGEDYISEEVLLPFAEEAAGVYPIMVRVNFQPQQFLKIKSLTQVTGDPLDFRIVPLTR